MISSMQKLSGDMIIYSALIADFEKLDFKDDALAGVRANYFNARGAEQKEKTEIEIDGRVCGLSYTMRRGEPISWKVTYNHLPYQTVKRAAEGSYCVLTYGENGTVVKRIYFDGEHNWTKTEYYDESVESLLRAEVTPQKRDGVMTLRLELTDDYDRRQTLRLYPSQRPSGQKCRGLVYTNAGMLWFDESFQPAQQSAAPQEDSAEGFGFTVQDFTEPTDEPLDLQAAPYLSEADIPEMPAAADEKGEEEAAYSAYDTIEKILFEAHKTNKNIFGEVAVYSDAVGEEEEQKPVDMQEAGEATETPDEVQPEDSEAELSPIADEVSEPVAETAEQVTFVSGQEEEAQASFDTKGGTYAYYGALDENGKRTGRGRMTSPQGVTVYDGMYEADRRSGFGICYYKDGSPNYAGNWEDGSRSGTGVGYRLSDGILHAGKWRDNKPEGFGARFDSDGGFMDVCFYENGVRNGAAVSFDENGNILLQKWQDGTLISEQVIANDT